MIREQMSRDLKVGPEAGVKAGLKTRLYVFVLVLCFVALHRSAAQEIIPEPPIADLEPLVAEQLRDSRAQFDRARASVQDDRRKLADAHGTLAQVYHAYEFFEAADAAYRNAAALAPREWKWPHLLGCLYQQTGRLEEAAQRLAEARRLHADDHAAVVRLGQVYLELDRLKEAREQFELVAGIFPALSRQGLGEVALREGRFDQAVTQLTAALERVPTADSIHYSLAMAYRGLGRLDEARAHLARRGTNGIRVGDPLFDDLQKLVRGERGLVAQGRRAYEAGRFDEAAEAFRKAITAAPASATAHANLGLALVRLGKPGDAVKSFESALRLDPANVTAHASLGMLLADQGSTQAALNHLRTAFEHTPEDRNVAVALLRQLLRLGRADEAIDVMTRLRSFDPDDENTLVSVSILLADRGRYREAMQLLDDANRRFPERTSTATTLARLLASSPDFSLRDGQRALALATKVYTTAPAPVHRETVALALVELGRCGEALEWMKRAVAEAEQTKDAGEAARLKGELPKYESATCRPGR